MEHLLNLILGPLRQAGLPPGGRDSADVVGGDLAAWLDAVAPGDAAADAVPRDATVAAAEPDEDADMAEDRWISLGSVIEREVEAWTGITALILPAADARGALGNEMSAEADAEADGLAPARSGSGATVASGIAGDAQRTPAAAVVDGADPVLADEAATARARGHDAPASLQAVDTHGGRGAVAAVRAGAEALDAGAVAMEGLGNDASTQRGAARSDVSGPPVTASLADGAARAAPAAGVPASTRAPEESRLDPRGEASLKPTAPRLSRTPREGSPTVLAGHPVAKGPLAEAAAPARTVPQTGGAHPSQPAPSDRTARAVELRRELARAGSELARGASDAVPRAFADAAKPGVSLEILPPGLALPLESAGADPLRADAGAQTAQARPGEGAAQTLAHSVARQIGGAQLAHRQGEIEIALSPEELGRVRLVVSGGERGAIVTVFFDRPDVLDLMRRHPEQLLQDLRDSGFAEAQLDLRDGSAGQRQRYDRPAANGEGAPPDLADAPASAPRPADPTRLAASAAAGERHLDIRL